MSEKKAIFAGGCFWGVEHLFKDVPGVISTIVGYTGGTAEQPNYEQVCSGTTGHAEALEVIYDSSKVSYKKLAKLFFEIHDFTDKGGQGPDRGTQYRTEIFYFDDEQKRICEGLIDLLKRRGFDVATKLTPATAFYPAEEYHQKYYEKTGKEPYCHMRVKRF